MTQAERDKLNAENANFYAQPIRQLTERAAAFMDQGPRINHETLSTPPLVPTDSHIAPTTDQAPADQDDSMRPSQENGQAEPQAEQDYSHLPAYLQNRPTDNYRLPDGTIVPIYRDTARGARLIDFTLKGGRVTYALLVAEPDQAEPTAPQARTCKGCGKPKGCLPFAGHGYWHLRCFRLDRKKEPRS